MRVPAALGCAQFDEVEHFNGICGDDIARVYPVGNFRVVRVLRAGGDERAQQLIAVSNKREFANGGLQHSGARNGKNCFFGAGA